MEDSEKVVLAVCVAVGQAVTLLAEDNEPNPTRSIKQIMAVTVLDFEPMLHSAACSSWLDDNLRCTKYTFLKIASFLKTQSIRFAAAKVKQHSFNKKVAVAIYFVGSSGGYRELGAAMEMSRSYGMAITTEVVCVLNGASSQFFSFPMDRPGWSAIETGLNLGTITWVLLVQLMDICFQLSVLMPSMYFTAERRILPSLYKQL
ncbi:hypothetical protein GQ600_9372 [Phytophthora cactorum]|nr:hypothetical protein GQ600_9372 [Phytophthora cactorum]